MHTRSPIHPPVTRHVVLATTLLALGATGCATIHRQPATRASLAHEATLLRAAEEARVDTVIARLARQAVARGDRTLDILLLSGGAGVGAYGAGFLRGWKSRSDSVMPSFDLVTGISTGALQSPFALIGTVAALDTLRALYLESEKRIAPSLDWWFWLRRTGGVINTTRFRQTVATVMDSTMRRNLLQAVGEGRQLVIGTTDYDLGIGRTWNIGDELHAGDGAMERVRSLLVTSASVPGIFPPVILDGHVHGDGGVISNVLPGLSLGGYMRLAERLKALGTTEPVTVRLWVILNIWTHAVPTPVDPASRKAISRRSTLLLFAAQQSQLLERLAEVAHAVNHGVDGLRMQMRYAAPPQGMSLEPGADRLLDGALMTRLDGLGYERARSATPWETLPPSPYLRPR